MRPAWKKKKEFNSTVDLLKKKKHCLFSTKKFPKKDSSPCNVYEWNFIASLLFNIDKLTQQIINLLIKKIKYNKNLEIAVHTKIC